MHLNLPYILATNRLDDFIWRCPQELGDDGELIDVILAWKQWLSLEHFRKYTSSAPDIDLHIILLPCKHDLRRPVVPCRYISGHLWILYTGEAEVANLEIAILVDKDVARL